MLVDKVTITVKAGDGGNGAVSFRRNEGNPFGGPDGGNGGNGGDVYVQGVNDLSALSQFQYKKKWKADDGVAGKRKNLFGKNANDLIILVPVGTLITDGDGKLVADINKESIKILLAKGGKGGRGNNEFKSATNQTPKYAEKGEKGDELELQLELKLIAQVGIIGLPNAGKSTLLAHLTNANPKIGDYPFTTLEPNVGMLGKYMLADIPGLIEGASEGKGLGVKFLKHIEKTEFLIHCIDASSEDVEKSYKIIMDELGSFNSNLSRKKQIILLTKSDKISEDNLSEKIEILKKFSLEIFTINIYDLEIVDTFKKSILSILEGFLPTPSSAATRATP